MCIPKLSPRRYRMRFAVTSPSDGEDVKRKDDREAKEPHTASEQKSLELTDSICGRI